MPYQCTEMREVVFLIETLVHSMSSGKSSRPELLEHQWERVDMEKQLLNKHRSICLKKKLEKKVLAKWRVEVIPVPFRL